MNPPSPQIPLIWFEQLKLNSYKLSGKRNFISSAWAPYPIKNKEEKEKESSFDVIHRVVVYPMKGLQRVLEKPQPSSWFLFYFAINV